MGKRKIVVSITLDEEDINFIDNQINTTEETKSAYIRKCIKHFKSVKQGEK